MNCLPANCPEWLSKKMIEKGGVLSFYNFMEIALNDPIHGYYGSGKAKIGKDGDFVTSTALSDDFAFLLAKQIEDWLKQIEKVTSGLNGLDISEIQRLFEESYKPNLIALKRAVTGVLDDME